MLRAPETSNQYLREWNVPLANRAARARFVDVESYRRRSNVLHCTASPNGCIFREQNTDSARCMKLQITVASRLRRLLRTTKWINGFSLENHKSQITNRRRFPRISIAWRNVHFRICPLFITIARGPSSVVTSIVIWIAYGFHRCHRFHRFLQQQQPNATQKSN